MAIKSFMGKRAKEVKSTATDIKVSDYMSRKLITFSPDQSVLEVMNSLIKHKISGGPVVNEQNELLGIISEGDCMKQISESRYYNMPMDNMKVSNHMVSSVDTIDGN
ncbi:MAG: CBS domain-containing protein, partial [Dokdonia donghaensis]|nr:CBS domain-containing protein [Dokdonia donghaensis]